MLLRCSLPLLILVKCVIQATANDKTYLDPDADYKDDSQACKKWYPNPVATYCADDFPAETTQKLQVHKGYIALAKEFENDPTVDFSVVNCYWSKNYKKICAKYGVDALPTLRIIHDGRYNHAQMKRHTMPEVDAMVREKLDWWSQRCPEGAFERKGAVPSLCSKRFMDKSEKNKWMVIWYSKEAASTGSLVTAVNEVAADLGNPGSKEKQAATLMALKKNKAYEKFKFGSAQGALKDRLQTIGPLVKVAGVCCDCSADDEKFCKRKLGSDAMEYLPFSSWFDGELREFSKAEVDRAELMEYVLSNFGILQEEQEEL
eukprot:TRINITY_DN32634_c0_g2_i2.p1 TRINITY_DN32634_c0_g2~~TRINITY_DN32634_c0_g2_i2.p1  ORF type:complete len:338 (-),score=65.07 TRINITY_DN32634_c0_g2_i2:73-1023(-)